MTKLDAFNLLMGATNLALYSFGVGFWLNLVAGIGCLVAAGLGYLVNRYA